MAITDWPEDERPRENLLLQVVSTLSDAELLAINGILWAYSLATLPIHQWWMQHHCSLLLWPVQGYWLDQRRPG